MKADIDFIGVGVHQRTVERVREKCVEFSVLQRQCLKARISDQDTLIAKTTAWQQAPNRQLSSVHWQFTTDDARIKLHRLYPTIDAC